MPDLLIRMQKKRDGSVTHTCVRRDGSATWQRHQGAQARFFPFHDLTHYAVETVLGMRRGFYGLVAEGWDFADFGTPCRAARSPTTPTRRNWWRGSWTARGRAASRGRRRS